MQHHRFIRNLPPLLTALSYLFLQITPVFTHSDIIGREKEMVNSAPRKRLNSLLWPESIGFES